MPPCSRPRRSRRAEIARIEIKQGDKALTLARDKEAWSLADRGGYPAKPEAVRALLVKLAGRELVESKTRNKDRFALLELEDPAAKDAKSRLLRLLDDKGGVIAETIIGKKRFDAFGGSKSGTYVRKPGDEQTWLSNADIEVSAGRARLGAADRPRPARGQDRQGDGRDSRRGAPGHRPRCGRCHQVRARGMPEGKKLKEGAGIDAIVRAAGNLDLEDVRKLEPAAPAT